MPYHTSPTHTLTRTRWDGESNRQAVLTAIADLTRIFGHPPTQQTIAERAHLDSPAHARYYLQQLQRAGLVSSTPGHNSTIRLTDTGQQLLAKFANNPTRCICVDFVNGNPDPIPNPDCPIHGGGFK